MPKHDFTPAKTPEYLESFIAFLDNKVKKASNREEFERIASLKRDVQIEYIASLHINTALLRVKQERLRG